MFSISAHLPTALKEFFATGGGAAASWIRGMYCTSVWIRAGGGGGMSLSRRSIISWCVYSTRLMLERASTTSLFVDIWDHSQCKSCVTLCSRPKDDALSDNRFQALIGVKKDDPNNG